jgi:hypothetical protein
VNLTSDRWKLAALAFGRTRSQVSWSVRRTTNMRYTLAASRGSLILLSALLGGCDQAVEYRVAGQLPGLQPGASLVVRGQLVGDVSRVQHRGETTFVSVRIARTARPLRAGDAVRTRGLGLGPELVLEVVPAPRAGPRLQRGGWLRLSPPPDQPIDPRSPGRELAPPHRSPPHQLLPPGPPPRRAQPVPVSLPAV